LTVVVLQATVFFAGMRRYFERRLEEVSNELNYANRCWSSSLVESFRLRGERSRYKSDARYYCQRAKRSEELESRFKREAEAAVHAVQARDAEVEELKARYAQLEEDKRTVEIKYAGLGETCTDLRTRIAGLEAEVSSERELRVRSQHELAKETVEKDRLAGQLTETQGSRQVLADEVDRMEQRIGELQAEVDAYSSGEKISQAARDKIWAEMMASDDFLDMQLSLEVGMAKRIRKKLSRELKDFEPGLLEEECMYESDDPESEGEAVQSPSAVSLERRRLKTMSAKPLTAEELAIDTAPDAAEVSAPAVLPSTEAESAATEAVVVAAEAQGATGLAVVAFSSDHSGDLPPVQVQGQEGAGAQAQVASEGIYEGCTGQI